MIRLFTILALLGALVLGPALCVGGLLEHACHCESGIEHSCEHEEDCADDPCSSIARPREAADDPTLEFEALTVVELPLQLLFGEAGERPFVVPLHESSGRPKLPYALSDRPLLA